MRMTNPKRPQRQRKSDRMIYPGASAADIRCDYALAPFDRLATQMDRRWGVDRLVELVTPEMAERYGSAMAKLNDAIDSHDPEQVTLRAGVCMRGLQAMDLAATQAGAEPASDDVWLLSAGGHRFGLMRDARGWQRAQDRHPDVELVSEREVVVALAYWQASRVGQTVEAVKKAIPGAEVVDIMKTKFEDEIPW